jgi:hypothetical protein
MIMQLVFKNPESGVQTTASDDFKFYFGDANPWTAPGFSVLEDEGSSLGAARVLYYVNYTNASYYTVVEFSLGSNRDFIEAKIR